MEGAKGTIQWLWHHYSRGMEGKGVAWSRNSEVLGFSSFTRYLSGAHHHHANGGVTVTDLHWACGRVRRGSPFRARRSGRPSTINDDEIPGKHAHGPRAAANNSPNRRVGRIVSRRNGQERKRSTIIKLLQ